MTVFHQWSLVAAALLAAAPTALGQCTTKLVVKGVNSNLPSEHGGDWKAGTDAAGNKYMTQQVGLTRRRRHG